MWRRTELVLLLVLCKYISPQPITETSNDRVARQLDLPECCPCDAREQAGASDAGAGGARAEDDCPCRARDADSEGAPSVFFPSAMRAAGSFLRPSEKREDMKPLFNPEVGLASSVLETLREATDEEYQDALARDAAKSAARAAEDILFGDANPQESANVVTIVVHPRIADEEDDVVPEASHNQQVRCIHPPLSAKMRMAPKSNMILQKSRFSKLKPEILHRRVYEMDSGVGASNVNERIVPIDRETEEMNWNPQTDARSATSNNVVDKDSSLSKVPEFRSASVQNKLKDLDSSAAFLLQTIRDKAASSFARVPKLNLGNLRPEKARNTIEDLNEAPTTIQEQVTKKFPYLKSNRLLEKHKLKSKPLTLTNLMNLRDVELIPLKDMVKIPTKVDQFSNVNRHASSRSNVDIENLVKPTTIRESLNLMPENYLTEDSADLHESPSAVNPQKSKASQLVTDPKECEEDEPKWDFIDKNVSTKTLSTEMFDMLPRDIPANEKSFDDTDCTEDKVNEPDSTTPARDNVSSNVGQDYHNDGKKSLEAQKLPSGEYFDNKEPPSDDFDSNKLKLLDALSVNKTISALKESFAKRLEKLKNRASGIQNKLASNRASDTINKDGLAQPAEDENVNHTDCQNEASMQVTTFEPPTSDETEDVASTITPEDNTDGFPEASTTLKPNIQDDNVNAASECSVKEVSLEDLQKLSDSMLQQEEQKRESEAIECESLIDTQSFSDNHNDVNKLRSNISEDMQKNIVTEGNKDDKNMPADGNFNEEPFCNIELTSTLNVQDDANSEASDNIMNISAKDHDTWESLSNLDNNVLKSPITDLSAVLKLPPPLPLPSAGGIKDKLSDLLDRTNKNSAGSSSPDTINSGPLMATDASTSTLQSRLTPSTLLQDVNFDIFEIPQSSIFPNIPKLSLQSYRTKLPLPDLSVKPINLQSVLKNKSNLLRATLPTGTNNNSPNVKTIFRNIERETGVLNRPLDIKPKLVDIKEQLDSGLEATNNIHSSLRSTQKALESRFRQAASNNFDFIKSPIKAPSLLHQISRKHEDINDKLRALHFDFTDRMETLHNELIDSTKLLTGDSRHTKPKLSSNQNKPNKSKQSTKSTWQASDRKYSESLSKARKPVQSKPVRLKSPLKIGEQNKFRMPAAASVPVPKIEVPALKTASAKAPPMTLPSSWQTKKPLALLEKQPSGSTDHKPVKKPFIKKESKITVSFSTTPLPPVSTGLKSKSTLSSVTGSKSSYLPQSVGRNRENIRPRPIYKDRSRSPSEVKLAKLSPAITYEPYSHKYSNMKLREHPLKFRDNDDGILSAKDIDLWKSSSKPKTVDSAILTKVKEAVQTRLSKAGSPAALKLSGGRHDEKNLKKVLGPKYDMARAASENKAMVEVPPLKENVAYKCKMICSKEK